MSLLALQDLHHKRRCCVSIRGGTPSPSRFPHVGQSMSLWRFIEPQFNRPALNKAEHFCQNCANRGRRHSTKNNAETQRDLELCPKLCPVLTATVPHDALLRF